MELEVVWNGASGKFGVPPAPTFTRRDDAPSDATVAILARVPDDEWITIDAVARATGLSRSHITKTLSDAHAAGLVERERGPLRRGYRGSGPWRYRRVDL